MAEPIEVVEADPQGADALAMLREAAIEARALYPEFWGPGAPEPGNPPTPPRGAYFIARRGGEPVAMGAHRPLDDTRSELRRLYTRPAARRSGAARAILAAVERHARQQGFAELLLETGWRQHAAIALYGALGWRRIPPFGAFVDDPTSVCFAKRLDGAAASAPPAAVFDGSGPGEQTGDGCSVELYRRLPYAGELADIEAALQGAGEVLELGCGTGRLCARLQQLGLQVTGVDASAAMLAQLPPGVAGVEAAIETLALGRRWPVVLLPSHLIHHPDAALRRQFVASARRHLAADGRFFVQCHRPGWLETAEPGALGTLGGIRLQLEQVERRPGAVRMRLRYEADDAHWTQRFEHALLDRAAIEAGLAEGGFGAFAWHGPVWVSSRPQPQPAAAP